MSKFRFLTAGESHGKGLIATIEGIPAGVQVTEAMIREQLARRQRGYGRGKRQQIETDFAEIMTGVRYGKTMGTPIALLIENADRKNANWDHRMSIEDVDNQEPPMTTPRPGHADLVGTQKFNFSDIRPVLERASARETTARVAVGAVAKSFLSEIGIEFKSRVISIVSIVDENNNIDWGFVENSEVHVSSKKAEKAMIAEIDNAKELHDTLGGVFEVRAQGVPIGLGSYAQWNTRLDSLIAQAMLSINAVKGVEIGDAWHAARSLGSSVQDIILPKNKWKDTTWNRETNYAGGIEGGISNGQDIVVRSAIKPISTVTQKLPTADLSSGKSATSFYERSDVCVVPSAAVIGEAMLALVLAQESLLKFGGDSIEEFIRNYQGYVDSLGIKK
ncbi:MAG: chorismate synthase [Dehalococcoidaceae bacterium]|nr:chorismate synthase [Dehalococcoidaceae bacterium]